MTRRGPVILCAAARHLLPPARRPWAEAMTAELSHIEDDRAALAFAAGCLRAALSERLRDADTQLHAGRWSIAVVTAFFALVQLACATRGVSVLLGAPDGMRDMLVRHGAARALTARYDDVRPVVVACFLALGTTQLATAWFLSRGRMRPFILSWSLAFAIAIFAVGVQLSVVWTLDGIPSEFHALLVQAIFVPALLAWAHHRHHDNRRR